MKSSLFRSFNALVFVAIALALSPTVFAAGQQDYTFTSSGGASIVSGTTDVGNHCDDCMTRNIPLPFPVVFYDQTFTSFSVSSDGHLTFTDADDTDYNFCLPHSISYLIVPGGDDLYTTDGGDGQGIFTSVSGSAPNRIFNIEWRTQVCCVNNPPNGNYEIRLYEGQRRIEFIYGASARAFKSIGLQRDTGSQSTLVTSCGGGTPASGTQYTFTIELTVTGAAIQSAPGNNFNGTVGSFYTTRSGAVAGDFTAIIDWGDGSTPSAGTVSGSGNGPYDVSGNHTYQTAGQFKTTITVTDTTDNATDTGTGTAATTCVDAPANMISWWPGDGNGNDIQDGNNLSDGTGNGFGFTTGEVGQAFSFNGSQFATAGTPSNLDITGTEVTLDGWIKPSNTTQGVYFGKTVANGNDYCLFNLGGDLTGSIRTINNDEIFFHTGYVPAVDVWTHVAMTYDGSALKVYVNGVLIGSTPGSGNIVASGSPFNIGGRAAGDLYFSGLIDEVEVFDRTLSAQEIFDLYAAGSFGKCKPTSCTPPPAGMVDWYPAEGNGDDIVGLRHGTLQNGASFTTGKVNQAFSFSRNNDGTGSYLSLPDNFIGYPSLSGMSFDAWFKTPPITGFSFPEVDGGGGVILGQDSGTVFAGVSGFVPAVYVGADGKLYAEMFFTGSNNHVASTARVDDNNWHHVAVSYNCSTPGNSSTCSTTVYLDGASIGNVAGAQSAFGSGTYSYQIGTGDTSGWDAGNGTWFTFSGSIDEVEFFNRGISAGEVQSIYAAGSSGKCRPCTPAPVGMVGWWRAEGNAFDSQDLNDGTLENGATFGLGMVGQAFSLNGTNQDVLLGNPPNLNFSSAMTADAWIYPTAGPSSGGVFSIFTKWNENLSSTTGDSYGLWMYNNSIEFELFGKVHLSDGSEPGLINGITTIPLNTWSHVALTYDAATAVFTIYVNGEYGGSTTTSGGNIVPSDSNVYIGAEQDFGFDFPGLIDEVEVFNRALSQPEIRAIYDAGSGGKCGCDIPLKPGVALTNFGGGSNDEYNVGRGTVFQANEALTVYGGGLWTNPQGNTAITLNLWETNTYPGSVNNVLLASATATLHDRGLGFYDVAFEKPVTLTPGNKYHIEVVFTNSLEQDFFYNFDQGDVNIGPVDVLDGTNNGDTENTVMPLIRLVTCPVSPADLELLNISSRASVGTGDNVTIAGFITDSDFNNNNTRKTRGTSNPTKRVLIRGIGPSLASSGVPTPLADPFLELHDSSGAILTTNDDWRIPGANETAVNATGLPPSDDKESALVYDLAPGAAYTAVLRSATNTPGNGLVEVYDLDPTSSTHLGNISTRAFVSTGDGALIGGVIIRGDALAEVIVRGIGPSLTAQGVPNALQDPVLDLHDGQGNLIASNDDYTSLSVQDQAALTAAGLTPTDPKESALVTMPSPGVYTAIVSGKGNTTGIGLVEAFRVRP